MYKVAGNSLNEINETVKSYEGKAGVLYRSCNISPINTTASAPITFSQRKPRPIILLLSSMNKIKTIASDITADQKTAVPRIFFQ